MNEESLRMLEELFGSMSTITQQELNSVQFDRTVVAKIVKRYEDSQTKYQVSTDSLKFDAYAQSDSARYAEGSSVYILIPDGDYSNNKLILGKYGEEDSSPKLLFTSPLDQIISTQKLAYDTPETLQVNSGKEVSFIEYATFNNLNITKNGIKDIDTICLDFSLTTQGLESSTTGEYCISLDFCDSNGVSLLLGSGLSTLLTIYSSQLNGNPYDLMQGIRFQFALPFPLINEDYAFTDLTKVKYVKIHLASNNNFDGINENSDASITLNDISVYMGITGEVMSQTQSTISLTLDNTDNKEYETNADVKQMSIDWFRSGNNVIYSEVEGYQYPKDDEYYIYWLQYSASDAYTKDLTKDDIEESGTYWKTVQKQDASTASAYTYTAEDLDYKRYEEVFKVGIRSKDGASYIESTPITFTNKSYDKTIGSNAGVPDTLTLTLSDDGVYNNYGIDNKLLGSNSKRTVTVSYVNNAITWQNQGPCEITWEIPAVATMIQIPKIKDADGNYIDDSNWEQEGSVYQYTIKNPTNTTGETISYQLQQQFGFNKTNNKIKCTITRYEDKEHQRPIDTYSGSITLRFGTQGTSGSEYAFNIVPSRYGALTKTETSNTFTVTLEKNDGTPVTINGNNVSWSTMLGDQETSLNSTGTSITIERGTGNLKGDDKYYSILVATLKDFTDSNGNKLNLKAYYPIACSNLKNEDDKYYYISGASRIVYNYQGTSPNYDSTPYRLYDKNGDEVSVAQWSIRFPGWQDTKNYTTDGKPNGNWQNYPSLETVTVDGKKEYKLKPLSNIQSNILACNVTAYKKTIGATDSEEDRTNAILWAQPLLIIRNDYAFPLINSWDGSLTINNEENYVLTQLIGAGTKNANNKYTGVLMGSVKNTGNSSAKSGIYGLQNGVERFSLTENGSFYVGNGNDNFISFNESSRKYDIATNNSGQTYKTINTSNALMIKTNKFILNTDKLNINSTATGTDSVIKFDDKFDLKANGSASIGGWDIQTNSLANQFVQDYYEGISGSNDIIGNTYNKANIVFSTSNNFILPWESETNQYKYTDQEGTERKTGGIRVVAKIGDNFGVTKTGLLYATGAKIKGKVELEAGSTSSNGKTINMTTITTSPTDIALKAFEQNITVDGKTQTLQSLLEVQAGEIKAVVDKAEENANNYAQLSLTVNGISTTVGQHTTTLTGYSSRITSLEQTSTNISAAVEEKVDKNGTIEGTGFKWTLNNNSFTVQGKNGNAWKDYFKVAASGSKIAGWNIDEYALYTTFGTNGDFYLNTGGSRDNYIYISQPGGADAFKVDKNGNVYIRGTAEINGNITIGGNATFKGTISNGTKLSLGSTNTSKEAIAQALSDTVDGNLYLVQAYTWFKRGSTPIHSDYPVSGWLGRSRDGRTGQPIYSFITGSGVYVGLDNMSVYKNGDKVTLYVPDSSNTSTRMHYIGWYEIISGLGKQAN